jgi:hypothetical protein
MFKTFNVNLSLEICFDSRISSPEVLERFKIPSFYHQFIQGSKHDIANFSTNIVNGSLVKNDDFKYSEYTERIRNFQNLTTSQKGWFLYEGPWSSQPLGYKSVLSL